jgi:hypothetical protein
MVVVPARKVLSPLPIGKRTNDPGGTFIQCRWLLRLVEEMTVHRPPHEQLRHGNALSPCDRPKPASLLGGELNLSSDHGCSVGTS